jgi:hypothetical protein
MKEIFYVFMKNKLFKQKVIIFEVKCLVHYFARQKENTNFLNDYFQVPWKVFPHY